ncbi:MAG: ParA family protein [Leptolyngbyaceae bacterium]|nr:ParA family protein [Leptolyngbyaceae bacterium]
MIILCTHNDGGVGKTTLAVHAVGALRSQLGRILLIDCDDQADSWQFYGEELPKKLKDVLIQEDLLVIWNKSREPIKRLAKPEQYDHVVLDLDSPLQNTVKIILDNQPDIVLVPVNRSQEIKALRNLPRTLAVLSQLESKTGAELKTIVVPLGVKAEKVSQVVQSMENRPTQCLTAPELPDLQQLMQVAIYEDKKYIWEYPGYEHLKDYFCTLLGI